MISIDGKEVDLIILLMLSLLIMGGGQVNTVGNSRCVEFVQIHSSVNCN